MSLKLKQRNSTQPLILGSVTLEIFCITQISEFIDRFAHRGSLAWRRLIILKVLYDSRVMIESEWQFTPKFFLDSVLP